MRSRTIGLALAVAAGLAGCGSSTSTPGATSTGTTKPITASALAASMKSVLISKGSDRSVAVSCQGGTVHAGQVVICSALATAGQGYRVTVTLPCWTATFNGTLIEGPGLVPPKRPKHGVAPIATAPTGPTPRPTNLPDFFSGCVK